MYIILEYLILELELKGGLLSQVENIHRVTIDNATLKKQDEKNMQNILADKFARIN